VPFFAPDKIVAIAVPRVFCGQLCPVAFQKSRVDRRSMKDGDSMHGSDALETNSRDITIDFLDLPDCTTFRKDQIEHILLVRAFYEPKLPDACSLCKGRWLPVTEAQHLRPFWDIPRGSPVLVQLFVPIMLCSVCGHSLSFAIAWLHATRHMTHRLEDNILEQAATLSTFTQIALNTGQDVNTVIDIFLSTFREFDQKKGKDLPRVLEIDEVYFHGRYYTILVDGESGAAIDLLEGRINEIIAARLRQARNPEAVEYVTQDFYNPFRSVTTTSIPFHKKQRKPPVSPEDSDDDTFKTPMFGEMPRINARVGGEHDQIAASNVARRLLPNAKTVGDHFHFKRKIQESFDGVRIHVKNSLRRFFFNRLKKTYTKEELANPGIKKKLNADVDILTKCRSDELEKERDIWSTKPKSPNDNDLLGRNKIFTDHPLLEKAWRVKNQGLAIFPRKTSLGRSQQSRRAAMAKRTEQLMDAEEAGRRLDAWVNSIDTQLAPHFRKATELIENWREAVIRIGTTPYSNAAAESKNRLLRMLEAIGRGLSFEQLRARLLWADAHRRIYRWPDCFGDTEGTMTTQRFIRLADAFLARNSKQ
jgi:transposase